jgi:transcriptional regulator with XRE-family HTH domain
MENSYTICEILGYIVIMWEIGERLRERRKAAELTQGQVVAYGDIGKTYLSNLEKGVNTPNWDLLGRLARRYKTTADYILGLTSDPRPVTEQKPLPEGATEIVKYLEGMSDRGREQLLKVARILYEDDQAWKNNLIVAATGQRALGEAVFTAFRKDVAAVLAEGGNLEDSADRIVQAYTQMIRDNSG